MITFDIWLTYTLACLIAISTPGPDNILAISRGLSQGKIAAITASAGIASGLFLHLSLATIGLSMLIKSSAQLFTLLKIVGAGYLIFIGIRAITSQSLISFLKQKHKSLKAVYINGFITNITNPKPALFILAFIPQFVNPHIGHIEHQSFILGLWLITLAFITFSVLGLFASRFSNLLITNPKLLRGLNMLAGLTFIATGVSILFL